MNKLIFELMGPDYELSKDEVKAVLEGLNFQYRVLNSSDYVLFLETECSPESIGKRLGLTHRVLDFGFSFMEDELKELELDIPPGRTAVDVRRVKGEEADSESIKNELGAKISEKNDIDLSNPEQTIFVLISDKCYAGRLIYEVDKREFRDRKVKNRKFFSPISLEPKYARCLINLARPSFGERLHDPFCGTGGILIEGGLLGLEISGGDISEKMVKGCSENLEQFDVEGEVVHGDVSETIPEGIDMVVTDPPYGRASTTSGEDIEKIYRRLFITCEKNLKDGGYLAAIFPQEKYLDMGEDYLKLLKSYKTHVHGSLKRFFCVYRK